MDKTYIVKSLNYPSIQTYGSVCLWTFKGDNSDVWFKIDFKTIDLGNNKSCVNFLKINEEKICSQILENKTMVVKNSSVEIGLYMIAGDRGRGIMLNITREDFFIKKGQP